MASKPYMVVHKLDYPINMRALKITGPTIMYIDEEGNLIQAELTDEMKVEVVEILKRDYDVKQ